MIALALAFELVTGGRGPLSALPPPGLGVSVEDCRDCHRAEWESWRGSAHARAWTNARFRVSFAAEPMRWCVYCHSPLAEQAALVVGARRVTPGAAPLADEGVGCAACHVRDGRVLSARAPSARAEAAHPMRVEPGLGEALCAGCHQFNFPHLRPGAVSYTGAPMQDTVAEWRAGGEARGCPACHLARGSHAFPGVALMQAALTVEVTRPRAGRAAVLLRARGAAHRVPTGDPFRRLVVELCARPACDEVLAAPAFARAFVADGDAWRLARDTTLPPARGETRAEREVALDADPDVLYWRLVYRLAAPSTEPALTSDEREAELARGQVTRPTPR